MPDDATVHGITLSIRAGTSAALWPTGNNWKAAPFRLTLPAAFRAEVNALPNLVDFFRCPLLRNSVDNASVQASR